MNSGARECCAFGDETRQTPVSMTFVRWRGNTLFSDFFPMTHGQCNAVQHYKRSMTHGLYNRPNCCTTHGAWRMNYPWVMGCMIYREDVFPMDYGLYNTLFSYYFPMTHGVYNTSLTTTGGPHCL
jgi:hypothetical protein